MKATTKSIKVALGVALLVGASGAFADTQQKHHIELDEMKSRLASMQSKFAAMQAEMQREIDALSSDLGVVKSAEPQQDIVVHKLEDRVASVESIVNKPKTIGNRVFFRGGSANLNEDRGGTVFGDVFGIAGIARNTDDDGWYFGAGFDFLLSADTLGLLPGTWTIAELNFEYRHLGSQNNVMTVPFAACVNLGGAVTPADCLGLQGEEDHTMMTVSAAPKLKFMEGSKLRPWIIPAGLEVTVIGPPSDSANYIDVGILFGAGLDYELIPGITLGADVRYHWTADTTDPEYSAAAVATPTIGANLNTEQENDAWTAGVSLGIGF